MVTYGQFCPMAKAMELFGERWTLLVVRELLLGSCHFNDLRRGLPRMSPSLLSKRLQTLIRAGVVERHDRQGRTTYLLTPRGRELEETVYALSVWGARWSGPVGDDDLDPHLLAWEMRRSLPLQAWPQTRTVLEFRFSGLTGKASRWWLVVVDGYADICETDRGYPISATISASLRTLTELWRGDLSWPRALADGLVTIDAPARVRRAVPGWLGHAGVALVARPA